MKQPHKHAALIKAWADGAEIEYRDKDWPKDKNWTITKSPLWYDDFEYRIKPKIKPDKIFYYLVIDGHYPTLSKDILANLKLTFDGETGKLKSAEVIND